MTVENSIKVQNTLSIIAAIVNTFLAILATLNGFFFPFALIFIFFGYINVKTLEGRINFKNENIYEIIIQGYIDTIINSKGELKSKKYLKAKEKFTSFRNNLEEKELSIFNEKYREYKSIVETIYKKEMENRNGNS
jgi:hypothetical protein